MALYKTILGVLLLFFFASCGVGQILGPPTAVVSIKVSSRLPGDQLTVYVNGEPLAPPLTDAIPTFTYRVRVQVKERYYSYYLRDYGTVYVEAWSERLQKLSRTKRKTAYSDEVTSFEFRPSDFR